MNTKHKDLPFLPSRHKNCVFRNYQTCNDIRFYKVFYLMVVSLCIGLRYEISVQVEVDDDVLVGLAVDPGHGEVVGMSSLLLLRVA